MKVNNENLSAIEWKSVAIDNINGTDILVLICKTAEQCINLFKLLRDNNYVFTVEKENGINCFVLLFDEYEIWYQPNPKFDKMQMLRDGLVSKITTAFIDTNGVTKVNIEVLDLPKINFNLN